MSINRIDNIFSQKEIEHINNIILESPKTIHKALGRFEVSGISKSLFPETLEKLNNIAKSFSDLPLSMDHAMAVEYSPLYGKPVLWPHRDGDRNDMIINIQLKSNTVWDMGLNLETYTLKDNSALVFNGNTETHWRVHKEFKNEEYVRMMFVRFFRADNRSDYSYLPNNPEDPIFSKEVEFRDSLGIFK